MDCYNGGQLHDIRELLERHNEMARDVTVALSSVATTGEMILRVLRNLELSFQKSGNQDEMLLAQKLIKSIGG